MDLLYLSALQNLSLTPGHFVSQCIDQLNVLYNIELNVYVELGNSSAFGGQRLVRAHALPVVRVSSAALQLVLSGNFSERALTIVSLEDAHAQRTFDYLTEWLWRAQQLHVLVVYPAATPGKLFQLFAHCWRQGMVHILVAVPQSRQLFSYMPYPRLRLLPMRDTLQYFHRTRGLLWDFHGFEITCGILPGGAPRAFLFTDQQNRTVYAGYMLRMALDFIEHYKGSIRTHTLNTLKEANEALRARVVDFLPYLLAETANFTGSVVLWHENCFLMAPFARLLPRYMYLLKPYSWATWLACLGMLGYCSSALFFLARGELSLSDAFLQILRLSLFLSPGRRLCAPPEPRRLLLYTTMTIAGLMLTNLYVAQLSSYLAAGLYERQVNSFDDLEGTDYVLPQEEVEFQFLRGLPDLHAQLAKRLVVTPEHLVDRYRLELNASMLHSGFADSIEFALYQQKFLRVPVFHKLPQIIYQQPFFMPAAYGRPYLKIFNWYVRRMFEGGILLKMKSDGFANGIQSGRLRFVSRARYHEVNSNDLEYYYAAAAVWLAGMLLASACFIFERCSSPTLG